MWNLIIINLEEIENMSRWIMSKEIVSVNKVPQYWKAQDKMASLVIFPTI